MFYQLRPMKIFALYARPRQVSNGKSANFKPRCAAVLRSVEDQERRIES